MRSLIFTALILSTTAAAAEWHWGDRFSHLGHSEKMAGKGKGGPACRSCHNLDGRTLSPLPPGKNNHKPCIDCHGGSQFMRGPRCLTCHSSIKSFKPGKPYFPPFRTPANGGEFHTTFPHAKHVGIISATPAGENCGGCHTAQEGKPGRNLGFSHTACGTCHAGNAQPDMNTCEGCHQLGPAPPKAASLVQEANVFRVTAKFSHADHLAKAAARGIKSVCTSCHLGLGAQDPPARPKMQTCEGCHNGQSAFDARGTQCGKCHSRETNLQSPPMPPTQRPFRHAPHQALGVHIEQCAETCHGVGNDWRAVQAGRNQHQPCQNCHAAEFRMVGQPICLNCHERNDPFAPNPLRPPAPATSEWRLGMVPHPPHIAAQVGCETCHALQAGKKNQSIGGHPLCGKCHKEGNRATLANCQSCHVSISVAQQRTTKRPWSTRDRFEHDDNHRTQPCRECHLQASPTDLSAPTMKFCAESCHDGRKAFKVTGFQCFRCHRPTPATPAAGGT